jgi:hypothetical protein
LSKGGEDKRQGDEVLELFVMYITLSRTKTWQQQISNKPLNVEEKKLRER